MNEINRAALSQKLIPVFNKSDLLGYGKILTMKIDIRYLFSACKSPPVISGKITAYIILQDGEKADLITLCPFI